MNCPNCGTENESDASFCKNCGAALVSPMQAPGAQPDQAPAAPPEPALVVLPGQAPPYQAYPVQPPIGMPVQPIFYAPSLDGACVTGMILGIITLVIFWFPFISWILGILAMIFSAVGMKTVKDNPGVRTGYGMGVTGLVTGIIGIIGSTIVFIAVVATAS